MNQDRLNWLLAHSHITPAVSAMDQALLTKHQVKGLSIGQVLFVCVLIDRDEVEVNKNAKRTRSISIYRDRTSLVNKGFTVYGQKDR